MVEGLRGVSEEEHTREAKIAKRPRRLQRGQKKDKKNMVKVSKPLQEDNTSIPVSGSPEKGESGELEHMQAAVAGFCIDPADTMDGQPKNARKHRRRKDGYNPDQLASQIVSMRSSRPEIEKRTGQQPGPAVQRPSIGSGISQRTSEVKQLKRRYGKSLSIEEDACQYVLPFVPTDPDFPYELPELLIKLTIPKDYPEQSVSLTIHKGLEIGFARNVERAFVEEDVGLGFAGRGILGMLIWLDRNLERLLGMKKSETMKIVRPQQNNTSQSKMDDAQHARRTSTQNVPGYSPANDQYSKEQLTEASVTRNLALSKLRMIHPSKLAEESFDLDLTDSMKIRLCVPKVFPLEPAWLMVLSGDTSIEAAANEILYENKRGLARTVNWLATNIKQLAKKSPEDVMIMEAPKQSDATGLDVRVPDYANVDGFVLIPDQIYSVLTDEEADLQDEDDESYSSGEDHDGLMDIAEDLELLELESRGADSSDIQDLKKKGTLTQTQEKGTAINSALTLTNISLMEPISLSLNLKCLRCKSTGNHISSVLSGKSSEVQCPTCSSLLSVIFRGQALHQGNSRIGYLDLTGASVLDLGPGTFSPTCEKCDVVGVAFKGLVAGQPQTRPCRACYIKQTVSITTTSFLVINSATRNAVLGSREAQNLNLQRGKPLPNNGVCKHYRKSNRWFRFNCCNKVYACDLCHEILADHPMELARFQICGWCSKESAIRGLKPCIHCGRDLTRRSRGGFWEGGQGTREQSKMNRNDPRKYRKKLGSSLKK